MRLTVCLESDTEGQVLASVDIEDVLKQCKENSISKEAFEKMKSKSHRHGYRQGYSKAIDDFANWLVEQGILGNRCISDGEITDYGKVYAKKYKEQLKAGGKNE